MVWDWVLAAFKMVALTFKPFLQFNSILNVPASINIYINKVGFKRLYHCEIYRQVSKKGLTNFQKRRKTNTWDNTVILYEPDEKKKTIFIGLFWNVYFENFQCQSQMHLKFWRGSICDKFFNKYYGGCFFRLEK